MGVVGGEVFLDVGGVSVHVLHQGRIGRRLPIHKPCLLPLQYRATLLRRLSNLLIVVYSIIDRARLTQIKS